MSSAQVRPSSSDQEAKATDMIVWCRAPPCTPQEKQWDDRKTLGFEGLACAPSIRMIRNFSDKN